jgi:hypothetical protein
MVRDAEPCIASIDCQSLGSESAVLKCEIQREPDFFLAAVVETDGDLANPRACWSKARLRNTHRDDYMLIEIEPPIIGQAYGSGTETLPT